METEYNKQDYINYTINHRKAFKQTERKLLSKNTLRGRFHDLDKVILYRFINPRTVNDIHVKRSRHHKRARTRKDYIQQIIDWQCAGLTKWDKPLNAYQTMIKFHKDKEHLYTPLLLELGLITSDGQMQNSDGTFDKQSLHKVRVYNEVLNKWLTIDYVNFKELYQASNHIIREFLYNGEEFQLINYDPMFEIVDSSNGIFTVDNHLGIIGMNNNIIHIIIPRYNNYIFYVRFIRKLKDLNYKCILSTDDSSTRESFHRAVKDCKYSGMVN